MSQSFESPHLLNLFSLQFEHGFYNANAGRCEDFQVEPTPACAAWMRRLGLLFRDRGYGFSVECSARALPGLLSLAKTQPSSLCLSFLLRLRNPAFIGITDLPITTLPTQQGLYANNLQSQEGVLGSSEQGLGASALYPLSGPVLSIQAQSEGSLQVSNALGQPLLPQMPLPLQPSQALNLDLSHNPYGLYSFIATPAQAYAGPAQRLFVPTQTMGLIQLLLCQPKGQGESQAFPLSASGVQAARLRLRFAARKTFWQFYVVSQNKPGEFLDDLAITGEGLSFQRQATLLPSGESALLFTASAALPLQQRSPYRFSLSGQRQGGDGSRCQIRLSPLPTAPALPVWPSASDVMSGRSEIFVYV